VAQLVERVLGKDEVMGSSPISSFLGKSKLWFPGGVCLLRAGVAVVCTSRIVLLVLLFWVWLCASPEKGVLKRDG
jgi:hypothetical protein